MLDLSDCIWFCRHLDLQGIMKRSKNAHKKLDALLEKIIKEQEGIRTKKNEKVQGGHLKHLLDILLDVPENNNAEFKLTRENIKAVILNFINHPHIFQKAREEIDSVVGKNRLVEESDIPNLPYLQATVKETLRLHPPDCKVGEYDIPKNTKLLVNVWIIGRDAKHWEHPLEFCPNRFIIEEGSLKSQLDVRGHQYQLLPFGSGKRGCPGISLALRSVQTTLANIIQCFELRVASGNGATVDMSEAPGLLLTRAHPLIFVPVARFNLSPLI
ncbi:hypothetical protein AQUCO_02800079v1 [Aquilegia coerulea]|uniref:Cytochrome P450 n=1 Tax=Aquilegia coerulea TaxID=218851 RepID=A0A2G5D3U4_AQUCA|nr:hypothetical protein AQUCO_02800079v1 [Aquilegia coerulea]